MANQTDASTDNKKRQDKATMSILSLIRKVTLMSGFLSTVALTTMIGLAFLIAVPDAVGWHVVLLACFGPLGGLATTVACTIFQYRTISKQRVTVKPTRAAETSVARSTAGGASSVSHQGSTAAGTSSVGASSVSGTAGTSSVTQSSAFATQAEGTKQ